MLNQAISSKRDIKRQLTLLCFALLLTLLAPVRVLCQPLSAYMADCGEAVETMDCCAMVERSDQPKSCCCEAPVTPGNMQTGAIPSTTPKFIPIKSQGAVTAPALTALLPGFDSPATSLAQPQPRTTKLPIYLRLRSLLI
jgi:hypothetical protein